MFLANLSSSLLQMCNAESLSYERAAERCRCSSRYFGDIVRKKSSPSLNVLENICDGFNTTPNELVGASVSDQLAFRRPMKVLEVHMRGNFTFPVCPKCKCTMEREYQAYCDRCGQCLSWESYKNAVVS